MREISKVFSAVRAKVPSAAKRKEILTTRTKRKDWDVREKVGEENLQRRTEEKPTKKDDFHAEVTIISGLGEDVRDVTQTAEERLSVVIVQSAEIIRENSKDGMVILVRIGDFGRTVSRDLRNCGLDSKAPPSNADSVNVRVKARVLVGKADSRPNSKREKVARASGAEVGEPRMDTVVKVVIFTTIPEQKIAKVYLGIGTNGDSGVCKVTLTREGISFCRVREAADGETDFPKMAKDLRDDYCAEIPKIGDLTA